jgi:hypothetical protein
MRCIHCSTPENLRCAGLDVRRFCELIDPSCPQYDPRYLEVIVNESLQAAGDKPRRLTANHDGAHGRIMVSGGPNAMLADCCGGGVPPGIFDQP